MTRTTKTSYRKTKCSYCKSDACMEFSVRIYDKEIPLCKKHMELWGFCECGEGLNADCMRCCMTIPHMIQKKKSMVRTEKRIFYKHGECACCFSESSGTYGEDQVPLCAEHRKFYGFCSSLTCMNHGEFFNHECKCHSKFNYYYYINEGPYHYNPYSKHASKSEFMAYEEEHQKKLEATRISKEKYHMEQLAKLKKTPLPYDKWVEKEISFNKADFNKVIRELERMFRHKMQELMMREMAE